MTDLDDIKVYTYAGGSAVLAGTYASVASGGAFQYAPTFLSNPDAYALDPVHLPLHAGEFACADNEGFFGVFLDCCAQEWGKRVLHLMAAGQSAEQRQEILGNGIADPRHLMLLGSGFGAGSLRFSTLPTMESVDLEPRIMGLDTQDIEGIRRLAQAMARADAHEALSDDDRSLLLPAISLGGSRPKALVTHAGDQWIAKFWRPREQLDIQRVELAVNHLALRAGIEIADAAAVPVKLDGVERTIFLSRRFDRDEHGTPVHYISAASLLSAPRSIRGAAGNVDVEGAQGQYSYMDIAHVIRRISEEPGLDLRELYRRMVFNMMIGNRDDHLCNHGFLQRPGSLYRLAPAFDIALSPETPAWHPICLGSLGRMPGIANVLSRCGEFGLTQGNASNIIDEVATAVGQWDEVAEACHLRKADREWSVSNFLNHVAARMPSNSPESMRLA